MFDLIYSLARSAANLEELQEKLRKNKINPTDFIDYREDKPPFLTVAAKLARHNHHKGVRLLRYLGASVNWIAQGYAMGSNHEKAEEYFHKGASANSIGLGYVLGHCDEKVKEWLQRGASINQIAEGYAQIGNSKEVAYYENLGAAADHINFGHSLNPHYKEKTTLKTAFSYVNSKAGAAAFLAQHGRVEFYYTMGNASINEIAYWYAIANDNESVKKYKEIYRLRDKDAIKGIKKLLSLGTFEDNKDIEDYLRKVLAEKTILDDKKAQAILKNILDEKQTLAILIKEKISTNSIGTPDTPPASSLSPDLLSHIIKILDNKFDKESNNTSQLQQNAYQNKNENDIPLLNAIDQAYKEAIKLLKTIKNALTERNLEEFIAMGFAKAGNHKRVKEYFQQGISPYRIALAYTEAGYPELAKKYNNLTDDNLALARGFAISGVHEKVEEYWLNNDCLIEDFADVYHTQKFNAPFLQTIIRLNSINTPESKQLIASMKRLKIGEKSLNPYWIFSGKKLQKIIEAIMTLSDLEKDLVPALADKNSLLNQAINMCRISSLTCLGKFGFYNTKTSLNFELLRQRENTISISG